MKNKIHFTRSLAIAALAIFMLVPGFGWGQLISYDNFNYADNAFLTSNGWVVTSAGANPIDVGASNGLTYTGYSGLTGITGVIEGNAARLDNTGEDDSKTFTAITSGTIYFSFLVNVTTGTAGYFIHLGGSTTAFAARLFVKPSAITGKINFGISNTSTASYAATPTDFNPGSTYLIIIKYNVTGTNPVSLWVKSSGIPTTEAAAGTPEVTTSGTGITSVDRVCLRQYSSTQNMTIDGIRIGPTWADILPSAIIGTPTKLIVTSVNGGSSPISGVPFSVAVQAQDDAGLPQPVTSDVNVILSGTGIGGTIAGTILNGQNSVTISGVTMPEGYGLTITATQTSGTPSLAAGTSAPFSVTSATPNYRSKTSGLWNAASTWQIEISSNWYDATDFPNTSNKAATILNGHTIEVTDNNGKCSNLTIDAGGKLWKSSPTVASYLNVYGNILNNGTIGSSDGGVTPSALGFDIEGTSCIISGSGTFDAWRMAKFTTTNATTNLTIGQDVTLRNTVPSTLYNSATATTLNIVVNSGIKLTVPGSSINLLNIYLTLSSGASLLDNGTILGQTGTNVTVERTITGAPSAWHFLSSPVAAQAISPDFTVSPATEYDFFTWYEQGIAGVNIGKWVNFKNTTILPTWNDANGSTNFVVGKGYLVQYQAANPTKIFTGMLNTGAVNFPMTISGTGTYAKTNLAGNPYPSSIDWKSATGWDKSKLAISDIGGHNFYIWNDAVSEYGVYNDENSSDEGINGVNRYIAPMQGFFVQTASAGDLSMTNAVRVHSSQAWLKSGGNEGFRIKVTAPENKGSDEILFELGHSSSLGGADKWYSFIPTAPSLSTPKSGIEYSISFLETVTNETVIPVSFKAGVDGQYTINANLQALPNAQVYLLDNKLVKTQNLSENPVYTFTASKTDDASRFVLHFGNVFGINETANPQPFSVYSSNNTVYVAITKTGTFKGEVYIYNTLGQVMAHQNLSGDLTKINLDASTGYYLVKVITAESTYTAKVFVKQQ